MRYTLILIAEIVAALRHVLLGFEAGRGWHWRQTAMKPPSKADLQRARINNLRDVFLVPKVSPQSCMTTSDLGKHLNNLAHGAGIRGQKVTNLETKGCRIHTNYSQGDSVI